MVWRRDAHRLGIPETARYMGTPQMVENRRVLNLSDEQFVRIDQAFAKSSWRKLLEREYCDTGSTIQKARKAGYGGPNYGAITGAYREDVRIAESELYSLLMPEIWEWQERCIHQPPRDRRRRNK